MSATSDQPDVAASNVESPGGESAATRPTASGDRAIVWLAIAWFGLVALRRAWLCDDAFVSLRVVDNFVHGHGLVFNVGERVQGYTNPLWVLLLAIPHLLLSEPYAAAIVTSLVISLGVAVLLGLGFAKRPVVGALGVAVLSLSEAAGDFATSGLENPLGHLLVLGFYVLYFEGRSTGRRAILPWLCAGLALTNRLDAAVILAPGVVALAAAQLQGAPPREVVKRAALGLSLLIAWELFSLVYYGAFVPNTAIAKLAMPLPRGEVLGQGLSYLLVTLQRDPMTAFVLVAGVALGFTMKRARPAAIGVLLNLAYVIWVGGDFMAGRFLSTPFVVALSLGMMWLDELEARQGVLVVGAVAGLVALLSPYRPLQDVEPTGPISGILSEREFYGKELGISANLRTRGYREHTYWKDGEKFRHGAERVVFHQNAGLTGYAAGPERLLVDAIGLTDAFLARMPRQGDGWWRVGHLKRQVPAGYLESLGTGENRLKRREHRELYERVMLITRGPLFSGARWKAIWWMHRHRFGVQTS